MENTLAATPKARLESAAASPPLAFPVPPPPSSVTRLMPTFAFPPPPPVMPVPHQETRRRAAAPPTHKSPMSDSLANLAVWVESVPMPSLPESAWTFLGRAWFFVAGATMGILLALALSACSGPKQAAARDAHSATTEGTARVLVIQRATTAPERGVGVLAENDLDDVRPLPAAPIRRPAVAARRPAPWHRGPSRKDILNAGL